jgi:hypothetical protein
VQYWTAWSFKVSTRIVLYHKYGITHNMVFVCTVGCLLCLEEMAKGRKYLGHNS